MDIYVNTDLSSLCLFKFLMNVYAHLVLWQRAEKKTLHEEWAKMHQFNTMFFMKAKNIRTGNI